MNAHEKTKDELIKELQELQQKLIIANKELVFQNEEKEKRATELIITNKELLLAKENAKLVDELIIANKAILQSEKNFHQSISESPLGIRIVSVKGKTIYANKALLDIYEFNSLQEFTSTPAINRYHPESYAQHQERKEKRKNGYETLDYEISIICRNAEIRHVKIFKKEVLWNHIIHFLVINQDITAQRHAEDKLRKLSKAVEQSPEAICITDPDGIIEYVNPKTLELTGYSNNELMGKNTKIFSSGKKPKEEYIQLWETIKSGNVWNGELYNKKKNGDLYWESAIISPVFDNHGRITHFLGIKEDITAKKQLLEELIAAKEHAEQSDRLKSAFLANMSHEIRTPMNGILGFAGLLKEPNLTGEEQQEYIQIIEKSGARMLNIINDIVDISKIQSGLMEVSIKESNINEQIDYIYTFFRPEVEGKGMQFSYKNSLVSEESNIKTDREKLYAILTHLVKNAIKYSKEGAIEFGYIKRDETLEFYVKDTGIGIFKDSQAAIFELFIQADIGHRRAYQGAGLGLSIAKAYVEMLGGKIWVESEEGIGSTFYFTLPYNAEPEEKK